ncbi:hypothetical protein EX895_004924 [Sporisorium graminicola]|uniref:Uncharacterized protein n=1 Tax=Sporisorium graminicola TaxID=280036 RepID=A0A4V6ETC7_9BASI|nr:hypothetical protein EX895_004924 [Sporisorium graminicola]TKY86099.1 hypothetical protein EX895_004924 [Sporisorium graminicola]
MQSSNVFPGMESNKKTKKTRRGKKKGPAGNQASSAKTNGGQSAKEGSTADVKTEKGKEKDEKMTVGATPSQTGPGMDITTTAGADFFKSKSQLQTPQKSFSTLPIFKGPLLANSSPLGTQSSSSMLTTASVGLNLARPPAAGTGGFHHQLPKGVAAAASAAATTTGKTKAGFSYTFPMSTAADAQRTLSTNKGPTAEELRRKSLQRSEVVRAKIKANAQKQKQQQQADKGAGGSGARIGSAPGPSSVGTSKTKFATVAPAKDSWKARPPSPTSSSAPGEWKVMYQWQPPPKSKPGAAKRKKEPSSSSSETAPLPATGPSSASGASKPAKKKPVPASSSNKSKPLTFALGPTSAGAASAAQPNGIKYHIVVYKKPYLPSMRPQRDCWHGRVGL